MDLSYDEIKFQRQMLNHISLKCLTICIVLESKKGTIRVSVKKNACYRVDSGGCSTPDPNAFPQGCKFVDGVSILADLLYISLNF